ncbi:hypothetical protein GF360_02195 [candidate division WWE3 bacterium]|nr:hypothetical protein [candidate division WWE3 bacterium]
MYYILLGIALILAYSLVTKLVSSLVKGCAIVIGLALFAGVVYVFIASTNRPITLLNRYVVEDFTVRKVAN